MFRKNSRPKRLRRSTGEHVLTVVTSCGIVAAIFLGLQAASAGQSDRRVPIVKFANEIDTILIPTPMRPIARGERLGDIPVTEIRWPKHRLTDEYLTDLGRYSDFVATAPLPKFLPIPVSSLAEKLFDGNAVVEGIPEGMRAITVKVDPESAVEGWARSGNSVDVIVIRTGNSADSGLEAKVIAENIKILSAGRSAIPSGNKESTGQVPSTVTLLVTQEDALKIKTGANIGRLTFSLRGARDISPTIAVAMDQSRLLNESKPIALTDERLKGYAKGPDGKVYVLRTGEAWARSTTVPELIGKVE